MDELDEVESLDKLDDSGDIKNKILFSVLVVSAMKLTVQHISNLNCMDHTYPSLRDPQLHIRIADTVLRSQPHVPHGLCGAVI